MRVLACTERLCSHTSDLHYCALPFRPGPLGPPILSDDLMSSQVVISLYFRLIQCPHIRSIYVCSESSVGRLNGRTDLPRGDRTNRNLRLTCRSKSHAIPRISIKNLLKMLDQTLLRQLALRPGPSNRFLERAETGERFFPVVDTGESLLLGTSDR